MSIKRPFRFGLEPDSSFYAGTQPNSQALSYPAWIDLVKRVEGLGYATVHMQDHFRRQLGICAALAAAASATSSIRLGSFVFATDFRHPVVIAQEAASVDVISGGRLELGIGSGFRAYDYRFLGIPLDPPSVRVGRLEEAVRIIKGFFRSEPFSFEGRYYKVDGLVGYPAPIQQPMPPIMIGGGSRRVLSFAAREADIVSVNIRTTPDGGFDFRSITAEAAREKVRWIREAAGDRWDSIELNVLVLCVAVTDHPRAAAEQFMQAWGISPCDLTPDDVLASPSILIGPVSKIVDDLVERRERYGFSYVTTFGSTMEDFAPVVARLSGL